MDDAGEFEEVARSLDLAAERADGTGHGGDALRVRDVGPEDGRAALPGVDRRTSREHGDERLADAVGSLPVATDEDGTAVRGKGRAGEDGDVLTGELDGASGYITSDGDAIGVDRDLGTGDFGARGDRHGIRTTERDGAIGIARARSGPHEAGDVDGLVDDFAGGGGGKHDASGGDLAGLFDLRRKRLAIRADEGGGEAFAEGERDQAVAGEVDGEGLARGEHGGAQAGHEGARVTDMRGHEGAQAGVGDRERAFVDDGGGDVRRRRELELTAGEEGILVEVERGGDQAGGVDGRSLAEEDPVGIDQDDPTVGRQRPEDFRWSDADHLVRGDGRCGRLVEADAFALRDGEAVPLDERAVRRLVDRDTGRTLPRHRGRTTGDVGTGGIGEGADGVEHRSHEERGERKETARRRSGGSHEGIVLNFRSGRRRRR